MVTDVTKRVLGGLIASALVYSQVVNADDKSADEEGIRANIRGIVQAINERDLEKYRVNTSADLVNMTASMDGVVTSTRGRQDRLDELQFFFGNSQYSREAGMTPVEIFFHGDKAFAIVDGTLKFSPKPGFDLEPYMLTVDLHLFFVKNDKWQIDRSMAIVRDCSAENETTCVYHASGRPGDDGKP